MIMEQVNLYITTISLIKQELLARGNLNGVSRKWDYLHKPVIRTQCLQATCKTSFQLLFTENDTIEQHNLSVTNIKSWAVILA